MDIGVRQRDTRAKASRKRGHNKETIAIASINKMRRERKTRVDYKREIHLSRLSLNPNQMLTHKIVEGAYAKAIQKRRRKKIDVRTKSLTKSFHYIIRSLKNTHLSQLRELYMNDYRADHLHSMQSLKLEPGEQAPTAWDTLQSFIRKQANEALEAIAFSQDPFLPMTTIPENLLDRILKPRTAAAHMNSWSLLGHQGNPESYAMTAWTNQRIIWRHAGMTELHSAPRQPPVFKEPFHCEMPGHS